MKKLMSLVIAVLFALSMSTVAFAQEAPAGGEKAAPKMEEKAAPEKKATKKKKSKKAKKTEKKEEMKKEEMKEAAPAK
jgi:hypothetical protein